LKLGSVAKNRRNGYRITPSGREVLKERAALAAGGQKKGGTGPFREKEKCAVNLEGKGQSGGLF